MGVWSLSHVDQFFCYVRLIVSMQLTSMRFLILFSCLCSHHGSDVAVILFAVRCYVMGGGVSRKL
jgi:hypothetical protein